MSKPRYEATCPHCGQTIEHHLVVKAKAEVECLYTPNRPYYNHFKPINPSNIFATDFYCPICKHMVNPDEYFTIHERRQVKHETK